jgi:hypothetical protein
MISLFLSVRGLTLGCDLFHLDTPGAAFGRKQDISVGIATDWRSRVRFPTLQDFSVLHSVQIGSGAFPDSYSIGTCGSFPGGKAAVAST